MAFNSLTFDGINSLDYGIYITGESVYDTPERDVDVVEIAGRNGDFLLDKGRWKNLEVTYRCGCFGADQSEFANKIRTFRNLLASRIGYKRITDTYNTTEYRMGTLVNPVEVDSVSYKRAGEFDLTFNCKPQRYLTSGETATTVANNGTLTNPTAYDASPLLAVKGYGTITFNGFSIVLSDEVMGEYELMGFGYASNGKSFDLPIEGYNSGDAIRLINNTISAKVLLAGGMTAENVVITSGTARVGYPSTRTYFVLEIPISSLQYTAGTTSTLSGSVGFTVTCRLDDTTTTANGTISWSVKYMSSSSSASIQLTATKSGSQYLALNVATLQVASVLVDSTMSVLGNPTYIDCELGEAYMIKNDNYISLNKYIDLGSDLPTLASGSNRFTKTNTITELKVTPRWWQL